MHPRCGIAFLICTVFIGFNLVFEELLSLDQAQDRSPASQPSPNLKAQQTAQIYKGTYMLRSNGSEVSRGTSRMAVGAQRTGAVSVQLSTLMITLIGGSAVGVGAARLQQARPQDVDILLQGVEFVGARRMTAFGISDPGAVPLFGAGPCRLDAVLNLRDEDGSGAIAGAPKAVDASGTAAGEASDAARIFIPKGFTGQVVSLDCGFSLDVVAETLDVQRISRKVTRYAVWSNLLTAVQIRCFLTQMRHTEDGPSAGRLSLVSIAIQALTDGWDSFLHLSLSTTATYMFNTFAVVSLFKFTLFALLEVRYMLTIWRIRRRDVFAEGWSAVRRELSRVYSYFYAALIGGLVIIFSCLSYLDVITFVLQAYWVPQIVHDVRQGSKNVLHPQFLFGVSVTRCLGLLYLWGCPEGIFDGDFYPQVPGAPSTWYCASVVLLQCAQVAILVSQRLLGPRWFVPWLCMPNVYNYRRTVEMTPNTDCVICMGDLAEDDRRTNEGMQRIVTPCDHRFHRQCLEQWMDIKMECPTCRAELPPIC